MWGDSSGKWTQNANVNTVWVRERVLMCVCVECLTWEADGRVNSEYFLLAFGHVWGPLTLTNSSNWATSRLPLRWSTVWYLVGWSVWVGVGLGVRTKRQTTVSNIAENDIKHFALNVFCYSLGFSIARHRPESSPPPSPSFLARLFGHSSLVSVLLLSVPQSSTPVTHYVSCPPYWVVNINEGYFVCTRWQTKS